MTDVTIEMLCLVLDIAVYVCILVVVRNKPYKTRVFERDEMTRKDYKLIAQAIKNINDKIVYMNNEKIDSRYVSKVLDDLVFYELGQALKEQNTNFNYVKFREACGF